MRPKKPYWTLGAAALIGVLAFLAGNLSNTVAATILYGLISAVYCAMAWKIDGAGHE